MYYVVDPCNLYEMLLDVSLISTPVCNHNVDVYVSSYPPSAVGVIMLYVRTSYACAILIIKPARASYTKT